MIISERTITTKEGIQVKTFLDAYPKTAWIVYRCSNPKTEPPTLQPQKTGKWLIAGIDGGKAMTLCAKAVALGAVQEAKHTFSPEPKGGAICCFYINGDSPKEHRTALGFLRESDAMPKKDGTYCNISFKFDCQTHAGEYGKDFVARYRLSDFMNLETGEFIDKEAFRA